LHRITSAVISEISKAFLKTAKDSDNSDLAIRIYTDILEIGGNITGAVKISTIFLPCGK